MVPSSPDSPHPSEREADKADSIEFEFTPTRATEDAGPPETSKAAPVSVSEESGWNATPSPAESSPAVLESRWPGALAWILLLPCIAGLIWLMLPVAFRLEAGLKYPYQLDAEEGFVYKQALDLTEGRSIYPPIEVEPYLVGNYPPAYPALTALLLKAGVRGLPAGRWVVAFAAGLIAVLLIGVAYGAARNGAVALLAPLLFLVSYEFYTWSPYARVDLPALAFTLAGIAAFVFSRTRPGLVFSALFFVAAAFTRQTAILAPISCALALLVAERRRLAWFLVPYLGAGLGLFVILNVALKGEFWNHLVVYNRNEMDWAALRSVLKHEIWFFYRWWILALAGGGLLAALGAWIASGRAEGDRHERDDRPDEDERVRRRRIFFPSFFILSALSLTAFAKSGSAANYALEPLAAASLFLAFVVGRLLDQSREGIAAVRTTAVLGLLLVCCGLWIHVVRMLPVNWSDALPDREGMQRLGTWMDERRVGWALFSSRNPDAAEITRGDRMVDLMRSARGEVLSELPIFALEAGKAVVFQPFIMTTLAREGRWDPEPLLEDFRQKRFELILTTQDLRGVGEGAVLARYTDSMAEVIVEYYDLAGVAPPGSSGIPYFLWKPAGS